MKYIACVHAILKNIVLKRITYIERKQELDAVGISMPPDMVWKTYLC